MEQTWVLAVPYETGPSRKKIIRSYRKMAYQEFDKQFKRKKEPKITERRFSTPTGYFWRTDSVKRTAIYIEIEKWHRIYVEASLYRLLYTATDGLPFGEAVHINNPTQRISIVNDLMRFYERFRWRTESFISDKLDPRTMSPDKFDNLDYILYQKLIL